jgi:hypothetical protein
MAPAVAAIRVGPLSENSLADFPRIPPAAPSKSSGGFCLALLKKSMQYMYCHQKQKNLFALTSYVLYLCCQKGKKNSDVSYIILASIKKFGKYIYVNLHVLPISFCNVKIIILFLS